MLDLTSVDQVVEQGIAHGVCPGACYAVGMGDEVRVKAFGRFMYCPDSDAVTQDTLWDLASVSKVVGCTSAAMILFDEGKLKLDRPVAEVIPEFGVNGKEKITPRNLLLHDSGLPGWIPFHQQKELVTPASAMKQVHEAKLVYATGSKTLYSDLSMVMMCDLIQHLSDKRLDEFVGERLFGPLGMKDTMYRPTGEDRLRCAPTVEVDRWRVELRKMRGEDWTPEGARCHPDQHLYVQGEVHDPTALAVGGVSGNAGLFSTGPDLAKFAKFMLARGEHEGKQLISQKTMEMFTARQPAPPSKRTTAPATTKGATTTHVVEETRALGWDTKSAEKSSAGHKFSARSYGHTGYTGTSIWIDPQRGMFGMLLGNRVHPDDKSADKIMAFRPKFYDALATACGM